MNYFVKEDYTLAIKEWIKALEIQPNDSKIISWIEKAKINIRKNKNYWINKNHKRNREKSKIGN